MNVYLNIVNIVIRIIIEYEIPINQEFVLATLFKYTCTVLVLYLYLTIQTYL